MQTKQEMIEKQNLISELQKKIEQTYTWICMDESEKAVFQTKELLSDIQILITSLISEIPYYRTLGVDLPEQIILEQLTNLLDGIENNDMVQIGDSLKYEIGDTLMVYSEILEELLKEE